MTALLRLNFSDCELPTLTRTDFCYPPLGIKQHTIRGKTSGAYPGYGTFSWTHGVQALALLFVRARIRESSMTSSPLLKGRRKSLAASLDYALDKQPVWLLDMFGMDGSGKAVASRIFLRSNRGMKHGGDVAISLNLNVLAPENITLTLDERELKSVEEWQSLLGFLEENRGNSAESNCLDRFRDSDQFKVVA